MFVNTRLYQYNNVSSQCVYIFDDFLEPDYQQLILDKTLELTKKDYLDKSTNVKANVTEVNELLQHQEYLLLKEKIASYLNTVITLRAPHWTQERKLYVKNMWGMQHFKGDYTRNIVMVMITGLVHIMLGVLIKQKFILKMLKVVKL